MPPSSRTGFTGPAQTTYHGAEGAPAWFATIKRIQTAGLAGIITRGG
jgi:hypothetical protein